MLAKQNMDVLCNAKACFIHPCTTRGLNAICTLGYICWGQAHK